MERTLINKFVSIGNGAGAHEGFLLCCILTAMIPVESCAFLIFPVVSPPFGGKGADVYNMIVGPIKQIEGLGLSA